MGRGKGSKGRGECGLATCLLDRLCRTLPVHPQPAEGGTSQVTQACHLSRERHLGVGFRHGKDMCRVQKGDSGAVLCAKQGP